MGVNRITSFFPQKSEKKLSRFPLKTADIGTEVPRVDSTKILGVTVDENLS